LFIFVSSDPEIMNILFCYACVDMGLSCFEMYC
jgi:hypothetical protein